MCTRLGTWQHPPFLLQLVWFPLGHTVLTHAITVEVTDERKVTIEIVMKLTVTVKPEVTVIAIPRVTCKVTVTLYVTSKLTARLKTQGPTPSVSQVTFKITVTVFYMSVVSMLQHLSYLVQIPFFCPPPTSPFPVLPHSSLPPLQRSGGGRVGAARLQHRVSGQASC